MLTIKEFAALSGIGERRMRMLSRVSGFPAMHIGRKIVIHKKKASEWLADYASNDNCGLPSIRD